MTQSSSLLHGRVDDEITVYVLDNGVERRIGQMPGKSQAEAIDFYTRKFEDLAAQVRLLEQRLAAGVDPSQLSKTFDKLSVELVEPAALGDLAGLRERLAKVEPAIQELRLKKSEANKEAVALALAAREEIVSAAEGLAVANDKRIWRKDSAAMDSLFERWQTAQKSAVKVPKGEADALWKRFSSARKSFDSQKRAFFAQQDQVSKQARSKKEELVKQAKALAASDKPSVLEYRKLLELWKASGRVKSKADDALWNEFKEAGDKIYAARSAELEEQNKTQIEALEAKRALIAEAKTIDPKKDLADAKRRLLDIQKRWASAGKVPKDAIRETEDKLRAIENSVRDAEQEQWRKTDPAAIERSQAVLAQLESSIEVLKAELEKAKKTSDATKIKEAEQALATRTAWLEVVRSNN